MSQKTILLAVASAAERATLRGLLQQEYNILEAGTGRQALMLAGQYSDGLAAVLLEPALPELTGYEVLAELAREGLLASLPVLAVIGAGEEETAARLFDMGALDVVYKPIEARMLARRLRNVEELTRHKQHLEALVTEQAAELRRSRDVIMDTLSSVIEHRSSETGQHVLRLRQLTRILLEDVMRSCPEYELDEHSIGVMAEAAVLHDVGKIAVPDSILNKPAPLTPEEMAVMRRHTYKGCEILEGLEGLGDQEYLRYAGNICRYHHERWDGYGYPDGLEGDSIPICAQAVGLTDAYDALITDRVYKPAVEPEAAANMILNGECGAFSPKLLESFKNVQARFAALSAAPEAPAPAGRANAVPPAVRQAEEDSARQGQRKYLALLRYVDATVLELDVDAGVYHMVYQENDDFRELRTGTSFDASIRAFVESAVHPEDRHIALETLDRYMDSFFGRGLLRASQFYRVRHCASGEYVWYECTALRVDLDDPRRHRALLIWRRAREDGGDAAARSGVGRPVVRSWGGGVQQCRNDRWFTMTYVDDGFVALFGYSREELRTRFHDRFLEMVHPDDREPMRARFLSQLAAGAEQELEYRVLARDGRVVWVLDRCQTAVMEDGREYLNCLLTDVTEIKKAQEALRLTMERYQLVLEQTDDIIFECDLATGEMVYSPNWEKKFGYKPIGSNAREAVPSASHLLPEDVPIFLELARAMTAGQPSAQGELRIANAAGRYVWCRVRLTGQYDEAGKPVRAVGVIQDIDAEKRRTQELTSMAEKDALTGMLNKAAANRRIQRMLDERREDERFALLILDLDDFKQINDVYGHMLGDAVLAEAAARLRELFRVDDVLSRFGGDEFLAFIPYGGGRAAVEAKAARVVEVLGDMYSDSQRDVRLTCSLGVALCPEDGTDFQSLFQRADRALYQAKELGKDRYALYDGMRGSAAPARPVMQMQTAGTRIDSDVELGYAIDSIVPQAFQMLYESRDLDAAVDAILEMLGRRYNVSRVYIFEDSPDGTWCQNTYEWCNEGVEPQKEALQRVVYEELGPAYHDNFNEKDIFYCRDVSALPNAQSELLARQGIRAMLQCAIRDNGRFAGFVGFDDCAILRLWTQDQIEVLTFISEFLSVFLLKKRAQDRSEAVMRDLRAVLDNQNAWLYVIDPESFALRYINAKTKETVPQARLGMRCYEAVMCRDTPCDNCPAQGILEHKNRTVEFYNPYLDIWSMADASLISWDGRPACLLACHDIAPYKQGPPRP